MRNTCCGVLLLAGGKSSRLGQNKALLEYDGVPMIRRIAEQCVAFPEKILSSPIDLPVEGFWPVSYTHLDVYKRQGFLYIWINLFAENA